MPKAKAVTSLSGMVESEMDDDTPNIDGDTFPTPDSNQENAPSKRKGRGKATAKKFTKAKPRRSGDAIATGKPVGKSKVTKKRAPLKEKTSTQRAEDTEEVDEFDAQLNEDTVMDEIAQTKPQGKQKAPVKKAGRPPKKAPVQPANAPERDGEFEYTPTATRHKQVVEKLDAPQAKKPNSRKRQAADDSQDQEKVIPETQVPMDIEPSLDVREEENVEDDIPQSVFRRTNNARAATQAQQPLLRRKRAGSASDGERAGNDPATRRKLGEMTKKFENIDLKYKNLKETLAKEAESNARNFEAKLQNRCKAADELIVSLRKELSLQKALSQDTRSLQTQITARDANLAKTQALANQLSSSLSEAQNENKALQAKLANSRNASIAVESLNAKTPGSALRGKTPARTMMVGSAEAAQAAQIAQLKEDLYSDLTGLILRGVERGDESDIYDCLQTGPNGTLHFKLGIAKEAEGGYDNTEFQYTPRLDDNRDRDLIGLLPEYLTDEITFSRTNAAMFYGRVVNCLTRKRQVED